MSGTPAQKKKFGQPEQEHAVEPENHSDEGIPEPSNDKRGTFRTILDGLDSLWNTGNRNNFFPW